MERPGYTLPEGYEWVPARLTASADGGKGPKRSRPADDPVDGAVSLDGLNDVSSIS